MRYSSSTAWPCVYHLEAEKWIAGCEDNFLTALILALATATVLPPRRRETEHGSVPSILPPMQHWCIEVLVSLLSSSPLLLGPSHTMSTLWELAWHEPHCWVWLVHIQILQMCLIMYLLVRSLRGVPTTGHFTDKESKSVHLGHELQFIFLILQCVLLSITRIHLEPKYFLSLLCCLIYSRYWTLHICLED